MQEDNFDKTDKDDPYVIDDGENESVKPPVEEATATGGNEDKDAVSEPLESAKNEEASSISSDLIRGHINTIILRALYERDKYGYEIMNDIEQKSHGQYTLKQPTLYSALKRLENQGYIKAYWKTDEVTSGGRRKYFTLTESGKEITEKNLAEWEYSRTIIDSLISDRSFDFSQPAPTPVDFTILRNSVSRVPVIKSDEAGRAEYVREGEKESSDQKAVLSEQPTQQAPVFQQVEQPVQQEAVSQSEEDKARELARKTAHENYLRLISEPVKPQEPPHEDIVPSSEKVDTEKLIYNNRPETERDYKNLIDGIFRKAISNGSVQTSYIKSTPARPQIRQQSSKLAERGRADGVAISTSSDADTSAKYATRTTYNKGLTLLKSSAVVLAICAIEFIFCFIFLKQLNTTWVYPTVILLIGLSQFVVCGLLAFKGYGRNCVMPTTNNYISTCLILTVISVLIISAASFLMNVNPNSASDVMKMIVIPSITALNISVFAVTFKYFIK